MAELTLTVDVDAPVEDTWLAATDFPGQGEWIFATRVRVISGEGRGVGARVEAVTGIGRFGVRDPFEITVWEPPHRCLVLHRGRVVRGTGAFEVQARPGGGSRLVWTEWLDLPLGLLGQVGWLAVRPFFAAGVQHSLRRFARWTEQRARSSASAAQAA